MEMEVLHYFFFQFLDLIFLVSLLRLPFFTVAAPFNHPNQETPQTSSTRRGVIGGERLMCGWVGEVAVVAGTGREELVGGHE